MKLIIIFVLHIATLSTVFCQHPLSINISESDGLPDIEFYDIINDAEGYFWFASRSGLYRYDGKEYKHFTSQNQKGLSVFSLVRDESLGRTWCVNLHGQVLYTQGDSLKEFADLHQELKGSLADLYIIEKELYVVWSEGILVFDIDTEKRVFFCKTTKTSSAKVGQKIYILDYDGDFYSFNQHHVLKLEGSYREEKLRATALFFTYQNTSFITFSRREHRSFFKLEDNNEKPLEEFKELLSVSKIIRVKEIDGKLWFATSNGVYVYRTENNQNWILESTYFPDDIVSDMLKDQDGNYWFTTLQNGIYVIPNIHIKQLPNLGIEGNISCLEYIGKKNVAVGTTNGMIYLLNIQTNSAQTIDLVSSKSVNRILYDPSTQHLFISTNSRMSYSYNLTTRKLTDEGNRFAVAKGFELIGQDIVYLTYNKALLYQNIYSPSPSTKIIENKRPYSVISDQKNNTTYIGYIDQLMKYDSLWNASPIFFKGEPFQATHLVKTKDGTIWGANSHLGLLGITDGEVTKTFTQKDGLVGKDISNLCSVGNSIWISSKNQLQKIDMESGEVATLTQQDGLNNFITSMAFTDSLLVFSSRKNLYTIPVYFQGLFKNRKIPEVYFTKVTIGDQDTTLHKEFTLPYDRNSLAFSFHANGYQSGKYLKYAYKLEGFDTTWQKTQQGVAFVKYNSLPAGSYSFKVKTVMGVNKESSTTKQIDIKIKIPFWKEWWFITLCVSFLSISLVFYFQKKVRRHEKKQMVEYDKLLQEKRLSKLKLENLRSQMNPHFIFNALNSIQDYIIHNERELASSYLVKFSRLIRMYLEHSQKNEVTLKSEIDALTFYLELEKIRFEEEMEYELNIDKKLNTNYLMVPSIFIQPYVENAIKHGLLHKKNNRLLKVNFYMDENLNRLVCTVEDNGIGREMSKKINQQKNRPASFATKANQERIDLYNASHKTHIKVEIKDLIEKKEPKGTLVSILIPIEQRTR
ncbi:histidine kinase [Flammeovirgaceae bacterium SG7u.111]|nr:histidine kinase [Flammeovirgaceae bacterium SG7u.132]WPO37361.1 histidine kinase [Flammeovirgaceae bacterium SG7u.111]